MTRPNFFIVGAPKCGTTSVARYLGEHPNVYMSDPKEPFYFNDDMDLRGVTGEQEYEHLFDSAEHEAVVGEASTLYLYSRTAVPNIRQYAPEARLLVMLRDPVAMVQSWHAQLFFQQQEDEPDVERAWELQEARREGEAIPSGCREPALLQYGQVCSLGKQLERVQKVFPRNQLRVVLLNDLRTHPRETYLQILEFLNIQDDGRENFPVHNRRKDVHSRLAQQILRGLGCLGRRLRLPDRTGLLAPFHAANIKTWQRPQPSEEFLVNLRRHFADDVQKLAGFVDHDLRPWLPLSI